MNSDGATGSYYREGRFLLCHHGIDAVRTTNREIAAIAHIARTKNPDATPPPDVTDIVSVHDVETRTFHMLYMHHLDYRSRTASAVANVVAFSKPHYAAYRTDKLQLATPAYYRDQEDLKPGIRDHRDGAVTKDATRWASTISPAITVTHADLSFVSPREPWVYCAAHYRNHRELRQLKDHFAHEYGYSAATRITDPDAFAMWLAVELALALDKTAAVTLDESDKEAYARSQYTTGLWDGAHPIDTLIHIYYGPVHYSDRSGRVDTQHHWFDPNAGPKAWFTKKTSLYAQSEFRFAINTVGNPVQPTHYLSVSPELRALTSVL